MCLQTAAQKSIPMPNPPRLVVDNANVIAAYDEDILEKKLIALDTSSGNQICVITVASLNGEIIEEVANKTFREWGIGGKKNNNGILLLVAINDRKVRIEVGYGLEGAIPDIIANRIINNDIKPAFKQGNYLGGINAAIDNLSKAAIGEYKEAKESSNKGNGKTVWTLLKIAFFVLLIIIFSSRGRGNGTRRRGASDLILPILFNSGGWGGGSSWSGGNSGGGGFGGFGGGSSGGGGASGSW